MGDSRRITEITTHTHRGIIVPLIECLKQNPDLSLYIATWQVQPVVVFTAMCNPHKMKKIKLARGDMSIRPRPHHDARPPSTPTLFDTRIRARCGRDPTSVTPPSTQLEEYAVLDRLMKPRRHPPLITFDALAYLFSSYLLLYDSLSSLLAIMFATQPLGPSWPKSSLFTFPPL